MQIFYTGKRHRFPNLACMKLSAYWKEQGFETELLLDYSQAGEYDRLYVSKVFTDTFVPEHILAKETTVYGGTGFFYDKAPVLPKEMEHHTPDYHLYDQMVKEHSEGEKKEEGVPILYELFHWFPHQGVFSEVQFLCKQKQHRCSSCKPIGRIL